MIIGHELFSLSNAVDTELYKMSNIWRYTSRLILKQENLAEHSYYVAVNVLKLGTQYGLSAERINKALRIALAHDVGELATGDIPHNLKEYSPEVRKISEDFELKFITENFEYFAEEFSDFYYKKDKIVNYLVELADVTDVIMFINREETLGNHDEEILQIRSECSERFIKTKLALEDALAKEKATSVKND